MNVGLKLAESSLNRIHSHMLEHDTGMISAFRSEYTRSQNLRRHLILLSKLERLGYRRIAVKGVYVEGFGTKHPHEVNEVTIFVIDWQNRGNLLEDLKTLGTEFEQDSILFIPTPGESAVLFGTSPFVDADLFPQPGQAHKLPNRVLGGTGEFMTRVKKRPFIFENTEVCKEIPLSENFMGKWFTASLAKEDPRKVKDDPSKN